VNGDRKLVACVACNQLVPAKKNGYPRSHRTRDRNPSICDGSNYPGGAPTEHFSRPIEMDGSP